MIKNLLTNWKTTSAGLTLVLGSAIHLAFAIKHQTADEATWTASCVGILGGIGLMFAGDASASVKVDAGHQAPPSGKPPV